MGSSILGKITASPDRPRGPDVEMRLSIPEDWLLTGATLELELPRNLACAACSGGGCDLCERSGAVSLRGRKDPIELVEVTLPRRVAETEAGLCFALRLPDRGGLPRAGTDLPRGNLLLSIRPGPAPERGVTKLSGPSIPPGRIPEVLESIPAASSAAGARRFWLLAVAVVLVLLVIGLAVRFFSR